MDPTTTREETCGGQQGQRPGDLISGAVLDGRRVAIDVGITSQAKQNQQDPIQHYVNVKLQKYRHVIDNELKQEGIAFRAAVWSQEGRPGRGAREVVDGLAKQTEKYVPGANKTDVRRRLQHEVAARIHILIVKKIEACIPPPTRHQAWLCLGINDYASGATMRDS